MYVRRVAVSGLALLATAVFAQTPTAEIGGQVTDASGALMANVAVVATNAATNAKRTSLTNEEGRYALSALPPGMYSVRAELAGFQAQLRSGVELQVGQIARIDIQMKVGNVSETVEVTAGAPVLQTESTELGTVIENKRILELPLNGRNYLQLASLTPGVTTNGPASSQGQQRMGGTRNSFAMNVSGQRVAFNHFSLDGMENTDPNFNTYLLLPSLEALQEFKVEAGLFQAEYGRAIAQVNVSTRGGTNELRGTLFHFLRNAKLDAKNYFDRANLPKPPFKRNQFGFVVGGPVYIPKLIDGRNKLFFFVNYEGLRERRALTQTAQMPTAAMRAGDLSFFNRSVIDPATRTITGNTATGGTPFPNATIPTSRIHPTSARVLREFYPLPNIVQSGLANNFLNNEGRQSDLDTLSFRGDWVENSNSNWFVRYSRSNESQYLPINIPTMGNNSDVDPWQGVLSNTRVFGANKVNDIRFGVSYLKAANIQPSSGKRNVVAELNIPDVSRDFPLYWGIPVFQIGGGFSNVGECNDCPFVNYDTIIQLKDDFSWTRGKHSFKLGGEARRVRFNQVGAVVPARPLQLGRPLHGPEYGGLPAWSHVQHRRPDRRPHRELPHSLPGVLFARHLARFQAPDLELGHPLGE